MISLGLVCAFVCGAAERRVLTGHRPAAVTWLQPVGNLPKATRLNLAIGLPLRDQPALEDLLEQIQDPASPEYHHYLSTKEFTERFGPTEGDYQRLIDALERQGFEVTSRHPNRLLLEVGGSAEDVERAFQVRMRVFRHPTEARTFFAPDVEPSVEGSLPVLEIGGLNDYVAPHPMCLEARSSVRGGHPLVGTGSGTNGTYMGKDFRAAYLPNVCLDGTGQNGDNITAACGCAATTSSLVGTYPIVPLLVDPSDLQTNYTVTLVNGTLTVSPAAVALQWANPAPITYGTALSASQLNATASVPGSFTYNPPLGVVLNVGTNTLSVLFAPTDAVDYAGASSSVSLVVNSPPIQQPSDTPLLPPWGSALLLTGLAGLGARFLARAAREQAD